MSETVEELDLQVRATVENLEGLAAMEAQLKTLGATAADLQATPLAGGGFSVSGTAKEEGVADAAALASQFEAAGIQVEGYRTHLAGAKAEEADFVRQGNEMARMMALGGNEAAAFTDRLMALGGMIGQGGPLALGVMGVIAAVQALVGVERAAIDNSEAMQKANLQLGQAYNSQGESLQQNGAWVQAFIQDNKQLISNQYDVEEAIAKATRAGYDQATVQRMAADALDLSASRGVSYAAAMESLQRLAEGNSMALRDLGFSTQEVNEIMGNMHGRIGDVNAALGAIEPKIAGAAGATTDYEKGNNALNQSWQNVTAQGGKGFGDMLGHDADLLSKALDATMGLTHGLGGLGDAFGHVISTAMPLLNLLQQLSNLDQQLTGQTQNLTDAQLAEGYASGPAMQATWDHQQAVAAADQAAAQQENAGPSWNPGGQNTQNNFNEGAIQITVTSPDPSSAADQTAQQLVNALNPAR